MPKLKIVNMIPKSWSDEANQDCEPNLSVNPSNTHEIIGTAFTFDNPAGTSAISPTMTGNWAPFFSSTDGGNTWTLQFVLPSAAGDQLPTWDVTARYSGSGGEVYSGLISPGGLTILINRAPNAATQQITFASVTGDQPFLEATTVLGEDRLYVGYNNNGTDSTVLVFLDANAGAPTFTTNSLDVRFTSDMPPTRTAIHKNGTIYCAFYSYNIPSDPSAPRNVVVVKDLNWGASVPPFQALIDSGDGQAGVRVVTAISNPWYFSNFLDPSFGNDRYGPDLAIAVDPNNDQRVYVAFVTGTGSADDVLHLRWSGDGGQTWSADVRTVSVAKNPSLAINSLGMVGFVYQQVVGANWVTALETSDNGFVTSFETQILASTPTDFPAPAAASMATYLGDYIKLEASGKDFFGTFCASNAPVKANFPSGVIYQRNVDWTTQTLLGNDGVTPVAVSIDPFFFKLSIGVPEVATAIANSGFFGDVCLGSLADEMLTINNHGSGMLKIFNITSTSIDFEAPGVLAYPLDVHEGTSIDVNIRFKPTGLGFKLGKIAIFSNDPHSPHVIDVTGECPSPHLAMMIANKGSFGKCCIGSLVDECLILNNNGRCWLEITGISSSSPDFVVPEVITYPLTIGRGDSLPVPIRFEPTSHGHKAATITVHSNDPTGPHTISVSGFAPTGKLAITGSTVFGGVKCCTREQHIVSICNVGECDLHVSHVGFKHKRRCFRLINNPFPATVRPGSCLDIVVQYRAMEKVARSCELVIKSDDPDRPVRKVDLIAYTIWDCCGGCGGDGNKSSCNGCGCECCKCGGRDCDDDDDYEDGEDEE